MDSNSQKEINDLIDGLRLLDDDLMTKVFDGNIEATQLVLNIILERTDLVVKTVTIQKLEKSPLSNGRDVRIDIFAEDSEGNHYDVEIQRADEGAGLKRARFLSSALDQRMLKHAQKFSEIKDSYVIFITENDVLKGGLPLYHYDRQFREIQYSESDGSHIIYANGAYRDNSSDIGKLMHDFRCRNSEDMFYALLRNGVYHFKETEGGRAEVSKDVERYGDRRADNKAKEIAINLIRAAQLDDKAIAAACGLTEDQVREMRENATIVA